MVDALAGIIQVLIGYRHYLRNPKKFGSVFLLILFCSLTSVLCRHPGFGRQLCHGLQIGMHAKIGKIIANFATVYRLGCMPRSVRLSQALDANFATVYRLGCMPRSVRLSPTLPRSTD